MINIKWGSKTLQTEPKDIIFPLIYLTLIVILGFVIWQLISPLISLAVSGLILYLHFLRDIFKKKV